MTLQEQLNDEFDEQAYVVKRLLKGNKKHRKSVLLQKRAKKVYNEVTNAVQQ